MKFSINQVALAALLVAVAAIMAVSTISVNALQNLIEANANLVRIQRIVSSLELIRFHALSANNSAQTYVITDDRRDLAPYLTGTVVMRAEAEYLLENADVWSASSTTSNATNTASLVKTLQASVDALIRTEKKIVDVRAEDGFIAAQAVIRSDKNERAKDLVVDISYEILIDAKQILAAVEAAQIEFAAHVQRWIIALISSAVLMLVFFHGVVRKLSFEQIAARDKIAFQAMHDSLTQLANRLAVIEHLDARLGDDNAKTERALGGFAVMLIDLDGFKEVNDTLGHDAGDALLKIVASRIRATMRDSDFVARLGGDKFLIVLPQISNRETATLVANKLVSRLAEIYVVNGSSATVTASIGVSLFPQDGETRETLMKCADIAMYAAKEAGRNQVWFYDPASAP